MAAKSAITTGNQVGRVDAAIMPAHVNEVRVIGRLAAEPETRLLPSGDEIATWRLIVERDGRPVVGRPHLDTLECVAWSARLRRTGATWRAGDVIETTGSLRRRFWRTGAAINSRYEIETETAKRVLKI